MEVTVYEAGRKPLAKVAVTGGGRCNLTNSFAAVRSLESVYPRGHRLMKRLLKEFGSAETCRWFEAEGVRLVTQTDQCVFPVSQDAMEIVDALLSGMNRAGAVVMTGHRVSLIKDMGENAAGARYRLAFSADSAGRPVPDADADIVLVTTGGCSKQWLSMLEGLGLETSEPIPSLFSFNIGVPGQPEEIRNGELSALMGTVVENAVVGLAGTRFRAEGPLLITDWGMSGPAILKLSSYAARHLAENGYRAALMVNWLGHLREAGVSEMLSGIADENPQKLVSNVYPEVFNGRLWEFLLRRAGVPETRRWAELGKKGMSRLVSVLACDSYPVTGRNKFKGEFVTCGGVSLSCIDPNTLECRSHPGLYFAGEVLDIDAITGGFNLQAAWTTGYLAGRSISSFHTFRYSSSAHISSL